MDEPVVFVIGDRFDAEDVVDWIGQEPCCTRAELWAAIERYGDARGRFELADRFGNNNQFDAAADQERDARAVVRELIGMEAE